MIGPLYAALCLLTAGSQTPAAPAAKATTAPAPAAPLGAAAESSIRTRAATWWKARERRDHQKMYDLFEPSYRKQVTFGDFVKESAVRTRFDLADTHVESIVPDGPGRARVKVTMETHPPNLPVGRVTAEDVWVRVAGAWYKVHDEPAPPFAVPR